MKKQIIWAAGKYVLGLSVLAWVIWRNWDPPAGSGPGLAEALRNPIQVGPLCACAAVYLVAVLLTFFRWYLLVRAQDLPLSLFNALRLGLVGFYFSSFLPSSIGGDIVKAVIVAREQQRRTVAVATVLIDRALGLWGLIWVIVLLGAFFWATGNSVLLENDNLRLIVFVSSLIIGASLIGWLGLQMLPVARAEIFAARLGRVPKVGHAMAELWGAIWMYRLKQRSLLEALLISIASHFGFVMAFWFAGQVFCPSDSMDCVPSLGQDFLIVPIGCAIQAVFPSPGGIGAGEYGFGKLYLLVGKTESAGVMASLAQRMIIWGWSIVGFFIYLRMKPDLPTAKMDLEPVISESAE